MPVRKLSEEEQRAFDEANKKEEEEKARLMKESLEEDLKEEDKPEKPTEEQRQKWLRDERKDAILDEIERQLEESKKSDAELKEIAELREKLQSWKNVLDNPEWEPILRSYFNIVRGMVNKMCFKTVITIIEKDGVMTFTYGFFDSDGKEVITEFSEIYSEDEEK